MEVMQRLKDKRLTQKEAAQMLGISIRQVKRLYRAYKAQGARGLVSKRRGKLSNNRLDASVVQRVLDLIKEKYADFGPTLAHEKLTEIHGLQLSRESVRRIMIEESIWKPKKARKLVPHPMRERRACFGELVQIDGSEHAWFEERGPVCVNRIRKNPRSFGANVTTFSQASSRPASRSIAAIMAASFGWLTR